MTDQEVLDLLLCIDKGYEPSESEKIELSKIETLGSYLTVMQRYVQIKKLPESVGALTRLQHLYLGFTQISLLPESIGSLSKLQILDLGSTQVSRIPESIGSLTNLQSLDLGNTRIGELPKTIGNLGSLQSLDLSDTMISNLPKCIGNLRNLQSLNLRGARISELPDVIGKLTNLQSLDLGFARMSKLPETIGQLINLQSLDLTYTAISELPETIGKLTSLQSFDLTGTQISRLPVTIGDLTSLQNLNLCENYLSELPESLLKLNLDFYDSHRGHSNFQKGIFVGKLKLQKQPISLFFQDRALIEKYYASEKTELKESKVIFMGDGGAGKSYTIQRIVNDGNKLDTDTDVTHDITIEHWNNRNHVVDYEGSIDFWDFGGQDIYLSMHRCFMTDRSCYVIVLCNRQYGSHRGLMRQARYWLKNISDHAKDSPILIAVNTWKGQLRDGISLTQLKKEFPEVNIVDQIVYDAHDQNSSEFNRLIDRICRMAQNHFSFSLQFPVSWNNIRIRLRQDYSKENYIPEEEYYKICREELEKNDGYYDEGIAKWLLNWFNDLGYCFNYHDLDDKADTEEYQVMKPQWVIRAMYKIINYKIEKRSDTGTPATEKIAENLSASHRIREGKLSKEDVIDILIRNDDYSEKEALYIIKVLIRFKLAYLLIKEQEEFLFIPALCSDIRPDSFDDFKSGLVLKQEYLVRFRYLPETVIQQLMIKCYQNGRVLEKVWKYGFHIQVGIGELSVEMCDDTEINIKYYEPENNNNCLGLHEMRSWLKDVSDELGMESVRDFIVKRTMEQTAFISVKALYDAFINDPTLTEYYVQDNDIYQAYSVDDLLSGLFGSNYRRYLLGDMERGEIDKYTAQNAAGALSQKYVAEISEDLKQIISQLKEIADKKAPIDGETASVLTNEIIKAIGQHNNDTIIENVHLQDLIKELIAAQETGDKGKLKGLLEDTSNLTAIIAALVAFAKYGATLM